MPNMIGAVTSIYEYFLLFSVEENKMQQTLENVLNAGIALFRAGESTISGAINEVQKTYDELKKKGAADKSEAASKLRASLDDVITQASSLTGKAEDTYQDALKALGENYNKVVEQINKVVPEDKYNQIKSKAEELQKAIKERLNK